MMRIKEQHNTKGLTATLSESCRLQQLGRNKLVSSEVQSLCLCPCTHGGVASVNTVWTVFLPLLFNCCLALLLKCCFAFVFTCCVQISGCLAENFLCLICSFFQKRLAEDMEGN